MYNVYTQYTHETYNTTVGRIDVSIQQPSIHITLFTYKYTTARFGIVLRPT